MRADRVASSHVCRPTFRAAPALVNRTGEPRSHDIAGRGRGPRLWLSGFHRLEAVEAGTGGAEFVVAEAACAAKAPGVAFGEWGRDFGEEASAAGEASVVDAVGGIFNVDDDAAVVVRPVPDGAKDGRFGGRN